jgi:hypothetical protein
MPAGRRLIHYPCVECAIGLRVQTAGAEIHDEEGEIVERRDVGVEVIELDAVEEDRTAVFDERVAQMQIAVTVAYGCGLVLQRLERGGVRAGAIGNMRRQ